jgi:hypothetical protein
MTILNKSNEIIRPKQLLNNNKTKNNIIIISNHNHTKSQNKSNSNNIKNQGRLPAGSLLNNAGTYAKAKPKFVKPKHKVHDLVNAPYLKLPGSNSMIDEFILNSSSRSNSKRKSGNYINKKY